MSFDTPQEELRPIDTKEEVKKFDAIAETLEVNFVKCFHGKGKLNFDQNKGILRCSCGAAWSGFGLDKLYDLLIKRDTDIVV